MLHNDVSVPSSSPDDHVIEQFQILHQKTQLLEERIDTLEQKIVSLEMSDPEIQKVLANKQLLKAVKQNNLEMVRDALKKGAEINKRYDDLSGETVLHLAVFYGYPEIITELLAKEADPTILNNKGITPIDYADYKTSSPELKLLLVNQLLISATKNYPDNPDNIEKAIAGGADIRTARDGKGNSVLDIAIEKRNISLLEKLIQLGADVKAKGAKGRTPLHSAALLYNENKNFTKILFRKLAEDNLAEDNKEFIADIVDEEGESPVDIVQNKKLASHISQSYGKYWGIVRTLKLSCSPYSTFSSSSSQSYGSETEENSNTSTSSAKFYDSDDENNNNDKTSPSLNLSP
ncbi:MAG: hypothetical protein EPO11_09600 [Gammaproteobacteria bacterium]|nr:MAG: hypothetical protein EPO11_09600 [Gammaproteobacteria bacterium]